MTSETCRRQEEHNLAYKGQLQCIKQFDGSNDYGSSFGASADDVGYNEWASLDGTNAFYWRGSLQFWLHESDRGQVHY
jgi:hypothetical protein